MPEYLAPGVYVEEIDTGSKPIEGVSTSTAGMIGVTERGPVNTPILITSFGEFTNWFGGYLNIDDFSNTHGNHAYLPHAVEGFFTNGGKRVYITRILDTGAAVHADRFLFDRGTNTSADTLILRAAGEDTGTAANLPMLYIADISDINVDDWIRIGNGSAAEYRQVASLGVATDNTHVPMSYALSFSHAQASTAEHFTRTFDATAGFAAGFTLVSAAEVGDETIEVQGAAADIALLASGQLMEIGSANGGEYRFVTDVTLTATDQARVQLQSGLVRAYDTATTVTPLELGAGVIRTDSMALDANAGDRLIFVNDRQGDFDVRTDLVFIDHTDTERREVRRIGELSSLVLSTAAYEDYGAGSIVEAVELNDDDRELTAAASSGDEEIDVDDVTALSVGDSLVVGILGNEETVVIRSISGNTITLTDDLDNNHNNGDPVVPVAKQLTTDINADGNVLTLNNRLGLSKGDVIRFGTAPDDEYVTIDSMPNRSSTAPDAGNVILTHPVQHDHVTGTAVRRQDAPVSAGLQPTVLALTLDEDNDEAVVTDGDSYAQDGFISITTSSAEIFYHRLDSNASSMSPAEVELTEALGRAHPQGSTIVGREPMITVQAIDAGAWGNRLRVSVEDEETGLVSRTTVTGMINSTNIRLSSLAGVEAGTVLELLDPTNNSIIDDPVKVVSIDRSDRTATLAANLSTDQQDTLNLEGSLIARSLEFSMSVYLLRQPDPAMPSRNDSVMSTEVFRHLSMDPRHSRYIETVVGDIDGELRAADRRPEGESWFVRVRDSAQTQAELESVRRGPETLVDILPDGREQAARHVLDDGDDSVTTLTDSIYIGEDDREPENRTGLYTLRNEDDIAIVACPGRSSATIQSAIISHCENMRYRFAVLDGDAPPNDSMNDVQTQRQNFDTKYAALYYPWLLIRDPYPLNLSEIPEYPIPPSGHVVGVYARTDIERGVHKAPANEVVRGIIGLQRVLNKGEHDILNPYPVNINVIRDFRPNNRGIRIWGGRVITSDPDWKYVNVRRLLIFIENSVDRGLQWVVFEPNAEPLWARVRRAISNFLTVVWRNGALEGTAPEEAFFVKCDRTTMTQQDIDNGRLICVIGVAPVKPAEFVIIRIGLWTAHAES